MAKTDPNRSCCCLPEVRRWALLHDLVAHPVMALFGYAEWTRRFHDWTSHKAWPRLELPTRKTQLSHADAAAFGLAVLNYIKQ